MSWYIVADSGCNFRTLDCGRPDISYGLVPMKINVGGREFVDDSDLDIGELNDAVAAEQSATSSACPSAGEWAEQFRKHDNVIAFTISSSLSASYDAAVMARDMVISEAEHDGIKTKNVYVHDTLSAAGKLELLIVDTVRYLNENPQASFEDVVQHVRDIDSKMQIVFSLSHYDNLIKNGRLPKAAGVIANKLNIRMMGTATDEGTIKVIGSTRGEKKSYKKLVEKMAELGYAGGMVYIDHSRNIDGATALAETIKSSWPQADVRVMPCDGLCSYYAEETGMIIGFEWFSTSR